MLSVKRADRSFSEIPNASNSPSRIAQSDAEDEISLAEDVEGGGFLGDMDRVEQRQQQDVAADGHPLGLRQEVSHERSNL
jgi:hypothetical protein